MKPYSLLLRFLPSFLFSLLSLQTFSQSTPIQTPKLLQSFVPDPNNVSFLIADSAKPNIKIQASNWYGISSLNSIHSEMWLKPRASATIQLLAGTLLSDHAKLWSASSSFFVKLNKSFVSGLQTEFHLNQLGAVEKLSTKSLSIGLVVVHAPAENITIAINLKRSPSLNGSKSNFQPSVSGVYKFNRNLSAGLDWNKQTSQNPNVLIGFQYFDSAGNPILLNWSTNPKAIGLGYHYPLAKYVFTGYFQSRLNLGVISSLAIQRNL
jgi:hypothetical protein